MYTTILLAAALQKWDRYSAHALAARDVAATLAKGTSHHLYVLSVYDYPPLTIGYLPAEIASRQQDDLRRRTDALMIQKMDAYVAPLQGLGLEITPILRMGKIGRSYRIPGSYVTSNSMSAGSNALPRLLTLCTNSK